MSKILGLDLGTNSIGWAVVEKTGNHLSFYEHNNQPTKGVIVFQEGVKIDDKTGSIKSKAGERTNYRGARRLKFRRKLRKYETLLVLAENDMCPLTVEEVEEWRNTKDEKTGRHQSFKKYPENEKFLNWLRTDNTGDKTNRRKQTDNPYFFRDKFSRRNYNWKESQELRYELGRAFYHMAQRRGFKSNRLEQSDENVVTEYKDKILELLEVDNKPDEFRASINELFEDYLEEEIKKGSSTTIKFKKDDDLDSTGKALRKIWNMIDKVLKGKAKAKNEGEEEKRYLTSFAEQEEYIIEQIEKPEFLGEVKKGIKEVSEKMADANCDTLGQYFWHLYQKDRHYLDNKIRTNYTGREEHYLKEFDLICRVQDINSIDENHTLKEPAKRYSELALALYKAIFFQRPLKSQKGLVGKCIFEPAKLRCPVSRPEFEEFRMWQFINNIKIKNPGDEQLRPLNIEEKESIIPKFYRQTSGFKFQDLAEALFGKEAVRNGEVAYYKDRENVKTAKYLVNFKFNTNVSANPVSAALKNLLGEDWKTKSFTYRAENAKGALVERTADYKDIWHVLFTFQDEINLKAFAEKKLQLSPAEAKKFSKLTLLQGYTTISLKAISKILPWLEKGLIYPHAVFMANIENVVDAGVWEKNKEEIAKGIGKIIASHDEVKKIVNVVNNLIADCREGNEYGQPYTYSKEAEPGYIEDLENQLQSQYGRTTWKEKPENEKREIRQEAFELFKQQLQKNELKGGEFAKVKRLDERVKEFLLGKNPDGEVYCSSEEQIDDNLYHPSDLESFKPILAKDKEGEPVEIDGKALEILPLPKTDAIKNPTLMRAMHQLRKLVNELLMKGIIDKGTAIHIELAREINDPNKRKAIEKWQEEQEKKKKEAIDEIKKLYKAECGKEVQPSKDDVLRYLLWNEQNQKSIYEDECKSISICDIIGPDPVYDIEHTLPRSRSWDDSMENKTLCSKKFNRATKVNKIPFELGTEKLEEILQRIKHWKERYEKLDDEIKKMKPSHIQDVEKRNQKTQEKHVKTFERDYWKGKYERFTMKEITEGFKNSQKVETGLITRFAREYLGCLFKNKNDNTNVFTVDGGMVDQFRRAWGVNKEVEDKDGIKKKDRSNHIHHLIDAVTIACMTRDRYNLMAEAWKKEDEGNKGVAKKLIEQSKPWNTFTNDVRNKLEQQTLIVHATKDNVPKQSKKKLRKRGKIVHNNIIFKRDINGKILRDGKNRPIIKTYIYDLDKNGNKIPVKGRRLSEGEIGNKKEGKDYFSSRTSEGETCYYEFVRKNGEIVYCKANKPIYQQGDTARGQLHQETFYGAIKQPEIDETTGKPKQTQSGAFILKKDKNGDDEITYVVRKKLTDLSDSDLEKIIDPKVKDVALNGRKKEKELKKEIESLKKQLKNADNHEKSVIDHQIVSLQNTIENELYVIPPKEGKTLFTPIRKVRIKAKLAEPLPKFKEHRDKKKNPDGSEKYPHKKWIYVQNAENYCLAVYENEDRTKRAAEIVKMMDAVEYFNEGKDYRHNHSIVPPKKGMKIKGFLMPNTLVLFYKDHPEELFNLKESDFRKRLYRVRKTNKDGRVTYQHNQEARTDNQLKEDYEKKFGKQPPKSLTNGESKIDFERLPLPKLLLSPVNMNMLIEGVDFEITASGNVKLNK